MSRRRHANRTFSRVAKRSVRRPSRFAFEPLERRQMLAADYTLQILHPADLESGLDTLETAPNFAAIVDILEDTHPNSITISSGDNYIPGPFFNAGGDPSLASVVGAQSVGRADIEIMNRIGFDASALGNHEFDAGTNEINNILSPTGAWSGAEFPYLSSNLTFLAGDPLFDNVKPAGQEAGSLPAGSIAPSVIVTEGGEQIGVVGITTPLLASISSPGPLVQVSPADPEDMAALAAVVQPTIDALLGAGVDKIIVVSHLQQLDNELTLAPLLSGVDIIFSGGSDSLLADATDVLRPGDVAVANYPIVSANADSDPVLILSTEGHFAYVGRLVVGFDAAGIVIPGSVDPVVSGAYVTTDAAVEALWGNLVDPFAPGTRAAAVREVTEAVANVINSKDGNLFGQTEVFLNGRRIDVRNQETNFGNITADANLAAAKAIDPTVVISIKNGGGIRDSIGSVDSDTGAQLPPAANPAAGKDAGDVSQLDIENSLRFNNLLTTLDLSASDLKAIIEHGVGNWAPGSTQGRFPQVGGLKFSFDPSKPAGQRVRSLAVVDEAGEVLDVVVQNGIVVGNPAREFRIVTLNFLAGGGDSYPFPALGANRVDTAIGEQSALGDYLAANFPIDSAFAFNQADTPHAFDTRVQNLAFRTDEVLEGGVDLSFVGTVSVPDGGEISAYDPATQRLFVTKDDHIAIVDISDPSDPTVIDEIDLSSFGGGVTHIAVENGLVAAAVVADNHIDNGTVVFLDTDGAVLGSVEVGALPDMLTFTADGTEVLVANEGEALDIESPFAHANLDEFGDPAASPTNPEGSISIITLNMSDLSSSAVATAGFGDFNDDKAALIAAGVRLLSGTVVAENEDGDDVVVDFDDITVAMDLEPEYISISPDGTQAFVTLQEANAFAVVDIATATVIDIVPMGLKDFSQPGAGLDANDRDDLVTPGNNGIINIQNWPVYGLYMPDGIASFESGGQTYYITANEGDTRGFDEVRVGAGAYGLDATVFPDAATLKSNDNLGRLTVSSRDGNTDGDAQFEQIVTFGGRSFTIWDSAGNRVFDSGDFFEQITAALTPSIFNSNPEDAVDEEEPLEEFFDTRSDNKGLEPEGVTIGQVGGRTLAFVGIERAGSGVMVFDITNPAAPVFMDYARTDGDFATEGLVFISAADSPNGRALMVLSNEVSGTVTIYEVNTSPVADAGDDVTDAVEGVAVAFDASGSFDGDLDTLTVTWNFGDGSDPVVGASPTHTFAENGTYYVTVTVDDGFGGVDTDTLTVIVGNADTVIGAVVTGTAANVEGSAVTLQAAFTDLGILDTHTATIDWGDGATSPATIVEVDGQGTLSGDHVYATGGLYSVTIILSDDDGGQDSAAATAAAIGIRINAGVLEIVGSSANDVVIVTKQGSNKLKVNASFLSGSNQRTFNLAEVTSLLIVLGDGNDLATVANNVTKPAIIDGGAGNDLLNAGGDASVLLGGLGNDLLVGGAGRDVLIGGEGADLLIGGGQDDILIGGTTAHDKNYAMLSAIRALWESSASYNSRVSSLRASFLNDDTVFDDEDLDLLIGGRGRDWFFASAFDLTLGRRANEEID